MFLGHPNDYDVAAVTVQEVLEAIAETAFKASDVPLILSFENHCSYVSICLRHLTLMAKHCSQLRLFFNDVCIISCAFLLYLQLSKLTVAS